MRYKALDAELKSLGMEVVEIVETQTNENAAHLLMWRWTTSLSHVVDELYWLSFISTSLNRGVAE